MRKILSEASSIYSFVIEIERRKGKKGTKERKEERNQKKKGREANPVTS